VLDNTGGSTSPRRAQIGMFSLLEEERVDENHEEK
jgi:hypothetical protein